MRFLISNKIYIDDPILLVEEWAAKNLVLPNPDYQKLVRLGKEELAQVRHVPRYIQLYYNRGGKLVVPRGCIYGLWQYINEYGNYSTEFNKPYLIPSIHFYSSEELKLFDYQEEAVKAMLKAKGGVLKCPAGGGKTQMAIAMFKAIGQKAIFLVHTHDLLNQALQRFKRYFPYLDYGTITEGKVNIGKDITFATWQTLCKIDRSVYENEFNVVFVDECAHCANTPLKMKHFGQVVENIGARYVYGLSATPYRADGLTKAIFAILGMSPKGEFEPVYEVSRDDTNVMDAIHVRVDTGIPDSFDYLTSDGMLDYNALINMLSNDSSRNTLICDKIQSMMKTVRVNELMSVTSSDPAFLRKQIVLCSRVEQCEAINNMLLSRGIRSVLLVGKVTNKRREEILNGVSSWDVIVATYQLAKEGLDIPILSVLHLASPQKESSLVIQCAGRVERVCPNKPQPYIIDYVDENIPYCKRAYTTRKRIIKKRG